MGARHRAVRVGPKFPMLWWRDLEGGVRGPLFSSGGPLQTSSLSTEGDWEEAGCYGIATFRVRLTMPSIFGSDFDATKVIYDVVRPTD